MTTKIIMMTALLAVGASAGCDASDCESWCVMPYCKCVARGWWCAEECKNDYYRDQCRCDWWMTSISDRSWIIPDSLIGILDVERSTDATEVIAGQWDGVYVSSGDGEDWDKIDNTDGMNAWAVAKSGNLIIVGGPTGVFRSTNNGRTIEKVSDGLSEFGDDNFGAQGDALIISDTVIVSTMEGVFASRKQGEAGSWSLLCNDPTIFPNNDCRLVSREMTISNDETKVFVMVDSSTAIYQIDIATLEISVFIDDMSWCDAATDPQAPPKITFCNTWSLAVWGKYITIAPRHQPSKIAFIDTTAPHHGWSHLAQPVDEDEDVHHIIEYKGELLVQHMTKVVKYSSVSSDPVVIADSLNEHCDGALDWRYKPRRSMGVGFTVSPDGKWLLIGTGGSVFRTVFDR